VSDYEHQSKHSPRSGWWTVLLICACLAAWGLIQYVTIRDAPRQWDFGSLPDAPGQSIYSASRPAQQAVVPPQMQPLPGPSTRSAQVTTRSAPASAMSAGAATRPGSASSRPASDPSPGDGGGKGGRP